MEASTTAKKVLEVVAWERLQDECNAKGQFIEQMKHHAKTQEEFFKGEISAMDEDVRDCTNIIQRQRQRIAYLEERKALLQGQIEGMRNAAQMTKEALKYKVESLEVEVKDRDDNNKLAKEIIYHLTTKVAELESENERLRDQHATAPPLKRVCSITQRIYRK